MRPQFHFTRVSPGFSLKSTPLGVNPVGINAHENRSCDAVPKHASQQNQTHDAHYKRRNLCSGA